MDERRCFWAVERQQLLPVKEWVKMRVSERVERMVLCCVDIAADVMKQCQSETGKWSDSPGCCCTQLFNSPMLVIARLEESDGQWQSSRDRLSRASQVRSPICEGNNFLLHCRPVCDAGEQTLICV